MKTISLSELSESVRSFIKEAFAGEGIVIADESGRLRGTVTPYKEATPEEKQQAQESLSRLQEKAAKSMQEQGVTEDDLDRLLLEDD